MTIENKKVITLTAVEKNALAIVADIICDLDFSSSEDDNEFIMQFHHGGKPTQFICGYEDNEVDIKYE